MTELQVASPVASLMARGRITDDDVIALRREIFADGIVSPGEAEALFALHGACSEHCDAWRVFFLEALTDYLVHQETPAGHVSQQNADWLVAATSKDGVVRTPLELELLVTVLDKAQSSPSNLSAFALEQVALAVVDGHGPLIGQGAARGVVDRAEVEMLRRILHAFGGEGNVAITRAEAECLFRINDNTIESLNDPSWNDLFVKAVANFVLCSSGYEAPSRTEALRREEFLDEASPGIGGFFARMLSGGLVGILGAYSASDALEAGFADRNLAEEEERLAASAVTGDEVLWLAERIRSDQIVRDNERALLVFIRDSASSIHPDMKLLLDSVA